MISIESILKRLKKESEKSENEQYKMACAIFDRKSIISIGVNKSLSWKKNLSSKFKKWNTSIHAEVDTIHKAVLKKKNLKGMNLIVVRFLKDGTLAMAKPCEYCLAYINYVGINELYYSDVSGIIQKEVL